MERIGYWIKHWWREVDPTDWMLVVAVVALISYPLVDPDFGWHLRSGLDLLRTWRIPQFDPYSWTMPEWAWVNHEWLNDIVMAFIANYLDAAVLVFTFAVMTVSAFVIASSWTSGVSLKSKLIVAGVTLFLNIARGGTRPQVFTLLGTALTLWWFRRYQQGKLKHLWWCVPMFWLWANLHGGFIIGLAILGLLFGVESVKLVIQKRNSRPVQRGLVSESTLRPNQLWHLGMVGLASGAVTLINPYGWKLYADMYQTLTAPEVNQYIREWMPLSVYESYGEAFVIYLIILALSLVITYRKIEPTRWALILVLFIMSLAINRTAPVFFLVGAGFLAEAIDPWVSRVTAWLIRIRWLAIGLAGAGLIWMSPGVTQFARLAGDISHIAEWGAYPLAAVEWAKTHPDQIGTRMYNTYNYGGFLVWRFPEQKVFIDGRMAYWKTGGSSVFLDEQYVTHNGKNGVQLLEEKYGVDWAILPLGLTITDAFANNPGWRRAYSDYLAAIYVKQ